MIRLAQGVFTAVFIFLFIGYATAGNPFSSYSSQWDLPYFSAASVNNGSSRLTVQEKEFLHAFNLARMSPMLFAATVFEPWCEKSKLTPYPSEMISMLYNTSNRKVITADDFLKGIAESLLDRVIAYSGKADMSDNVLLKDIRPVSRYLLAKSEEQGAVTILLRLMADATGNGRVFRELFFENNPMAGFDIRKDEQGRATLLLFSCSAEEHQLMLEMRKTVIISPDQHIATDYRYDEELGAFMQALSNRKDSRGGRSGPVISLPPNAVYMEPEAFMRLKDSLEFRNIACSLHIRTYRRAGFVVGTEVRGNLETAFEPSDELKMVVGRMESDSAYDKYYVHRVTNPKDGSSEIRLFTISVNKPTPYLPADSIGHFSPTTDFSAIDLQARKVDAATPELLVKKLIAPQMSELYRVRAIFIWMVSHLNYDNAGLAAGTPAVEVPEIWKKRVAICSGYAALFDHLCRLAGIRSHKVSGMADGVELGAHAWNVVLIGGRYHLLDATWGEQYFLNRPEDFLRDHYPAIKRWSLLDKLPVYSDWLQPFILSGQFAPSR